MTLGSKDRPLVVYLRRIRGRGGLRLVGETACAQPGPLQAGGISLYFVCTPYATPHTISFTGHHSSTGTCILAVYNVLQHVHRGTNSFFYSVSVRRGHFTSFVNVLTRSQQNSSRNRGLPPMRIMTSLIRDCGGGCLVRQYKRTPRGPPTPGPLVGIHNSGHVVYTTLSPCGDLLLWLLLTIHSSSMTIP